MEQVAVTSGSKESGGRILVVRVGALGDTLMATPVVRALRARYPQAAIDFLGWEPATPLLEANPGIAQLFRLRHRHLPWWLSREKQRLVRELHAARYQFAVLLESAPHFRRLLERAQVKQIRSFRETTLAPKLHAIVNNLRASGFPDWQPAPAGSLDMELPVSPEEERAAEQFLGEIRPPLVGLHAGYGPQRGKKNQGQRLKGWGTDNFSQLGRLLVQRGVRLVLTGSTDDRDDARAIAAQLPAGSFVELAGRTSVRQLAAVIRRLQLFISVDTGAAHMAAAVSTPLVVLWGPAILEQTRPLSSTTPIRIVRHRVFCAPCYGTPMMKTCQRNICMEAISPQRVLAEAEAVISEELRVKRE